MNNSNQPGSKHVPGAIAILLAAGNYYRGDNGKRVKLLRSVPYLRQVELRYHGEVLGSIINMTANERVWEVEAVDGHLHVSRGVPDCTNNNCYMQRHLLIIGDESLVTGEHTMEQQHAADKTWKVVEEELSKV